MNDQQVLWLIRHLRLFTLDFDLRGVPLDEASARLTFRSAIKGDYERNYGGMSVILAFSLYNALERSVTDQKELNNLLHRIAEWTHEHFNDPRHSGREQLQLSVPEIEDKISILDHVWNA